MARIKRNNQIGGYDLWDGNEILGTYIPNNEFIFEDLINKEVRMEIKDVDEKEEGWKVVQKNGKYKMGELGIKYLKK